MSAPVDIVAIAQKQLDAYNAQKLGAYCSFFTDDVIVADLNGAVSTDGLRPTSNATRTPSPSFRTTRRPW